MQVIYCWARSLFKTLIVPPSWICNKSSRKYLTEITWWLPATYCVTYILIVAKCCGVNRVVTFQNHTNFTLLPTIEFPQFLFKVRQCIWELMVLCWLYISEIWLYYFCDFLNREAMSKIVDLQCFLQLRDSNDKWWIGIKYAVWCVQTFVV